MSKQNNTLDKILDYELRPWLAQNSMDDEFASKFRSLKEYTPQQPLQFEIEFFRPFDNKTKYYSKLILNTVKSDFDALYQTIDEDRNENLIRYYLNDTLNKRLKTRLKDLGELLKKKDYALTYINPKNTSHQLDQTHKANTYIMQLLKLAYMQLYLEVQEAFKDWVDDEFIVEDFYTQLLNEPIPEQLHIKKLQVIEVTPEPVRKPKPKTTDKPIPFNSFTYKQYNTSPDKLGDLAVFRLRSSANKIAKPLQHIFWNTSILKGQKKSCNALWVLRYSYAVCHFYCVPLSVVTVVPLSFLPLPSVPPVSRKKSNHYP